MLKVYALNGCPHCRLTIDYLQENGIDFEYLEIEEQPPEVIAKVVDINGGDDWVVPTLEFNGKWRPGEVFHSDRLRRDLIALGVISG
jgi:mycoredoxin